MWLPPGGNSLTSGGAILQVDSFGRQSQIFLRDPNGLLVVHCKSCSNTTFYWLFFSFAESFFLFLHACFLGSLPKLTSCTQILVLGFILEINKIHLFFSMTSSFLSIYFLLYYKGRGEGGSRVICKRKFSNKVLFSVSGDFGFASFCLGEAGKSALV